MNADKNLYELDQALLPFKKMAMFESVDLVSPESHSPDGDTPLHAAAMEGRVDWITSLLPFVSDIDVRGDLGNTPLHCAVLWGHVEVVRLLLKYGANIHTQNDYGDTPAEIMRARGAPEIGPWP
jgi:ankyrin repeat protein